MGKNFLKDMLKQDRACLGTFLSIPDPFLAEFVAAQGFHWVNTDMEHNPHDWRTTSLINTAVEKAKAAPLVRIPWNTGENWKRALDGGAWGVICPMINTKEEAEQAVAWAKYPPQGVRSAGGNRRAFGFGSTPENYYQVHNDEVLVALQIESVQAIENLEQILSVPGIDVAYIGPGDLSASFGVPSSLDPEDKRVQEAIQYVADTCRRMGVTAGIHCSGGAGAARRYKQGFRFMALRAEVNFLQTGIKLELKSFEDGVKQS